MGTIYSYTVVRSSTPAFADRVPYLVAVVEEGGRRVSAYVEGYEDGVSVRIGDRVYAAGSDGQGRPVYSLKKPE